MCAGLCHPCHPLGSGTDFRGFAGGAADGNREARIWAFRQ
jgi:hypothetical protein